MDLIEIDNEIKACHRCHSIVEKFNGSKTVSVGNKNDIVLLGEMPANNGWRKSGIAWYDINNNLIPSGKRMESLLKIIDLDLADTYFLEVIKCYLKDRRYLNRCYHNCHEYLVKQLMVINPKLVLPLGDVATKSLLGIKYQKFSDVAGRVFTMDNYEVIPIYHPSPMYHDGYRLNEKIFEGVIKEKVKIKRINGD